MRKALRVISHIGILREQLDAIAVKSREDARKLGPFVEQDRHNELVLWVNWSKKKAKGKKTRPHFRRYPQKKKRQPLAMVYRAENEQRQKLYGNSEIHNQIRDGMAEFLRECIKRREGIQWAYKDERISEFSFTGNLLSEAECVETEFGVRSPYGKDFRLDIAVLGPTIVTKPILLAAIELELTHEFEFLKCCLVRSLGAPLYSVDISGADPKEVDRAWFRERLSETTRRSDDGLRRNYVYLNNVIQPAYLDVPAELGILKEEHQFVVFVRDKDFQKLHGLLLKLQNGLRLSDKQILIQPATLNPQDQGSRSMFQNEGSIAGPDWTSYNDSKFIRITARRPVSKSGPLYLFHLAMSRLLCSHFDALVGYKYKKGARNFDEDEPLWNVRVRDKEKVGIHFNEHRLLPKNVSEPVGPIMNLLG